MRRLPILFLFLVLAPFAFAACGGGGGGESEAEGDEGARIACRGDAIAGDPGLPENFPAPGEFTVTSAEDEGATHVVVGYWESGLDEAYREWKEKVEEAGFKVTFDELEEHDSEVAYEGSGRTGIVQLKDRCEEDEVTYVRITSRPE
jgi:hypothetical protein